MRGESSASTALRVLHFLSPLSVISYFFCAWTIAACFLHKRSRRVGEKSRRHVAIGLLLAVTTTVVAQFVLYLVQWWTEAGWEPSEDQVAYLMLSLLTYGSLCVRLLEDPQPVWHPYVGSWCVGAISEAGITVLLWRTSRNENAFHFVTLALHLARTLLLVVCCAFGGWLAISWRFGDLPKGEESKPLLATSSNDGPTGLVYDSISDRVDDGDNGDCSDIDSDMDTPEHVKVVKEQQRKRLHESGSWLNYLKDFKIFASMLWPSKDRYVQGCIAAMALTLMTDRALHVLIPRQLGLITDELAANNQRGVFPWKEVGFWMLLSWLQSYAGTQLINSLAQVPVSQFASKSLGTTAFRHIMSLSMDFHNDKNSGELIRAIEQGQNLQLLLDFVFFSIVPTLVDIIIAFVYVYLLFDIYLSCMLAFMAIAYTWIGAKATAWTVKRRRQLNTAWRGESRVQNEAISNWETVSYFNREKYECERYSNTIDALNSAELSFYFAYYVGTAAQALVMLFGQLVVMSLAIYRVSQGKAPIGNFIALNSYWGSIEGPLSGVARSVRRLTQMVTDAERLLQLLQTKPTVADAPNATELLVKSGRIEFEAVEFAYDQRRPILKDVSFEAKPGQTIAFVGETGAGKSTVFKLLYRYYDVLNGSIRIDGHDIRSVTMDSLRNSFGMVPQDTALFNLSIMENVRYARLDATDEEVKDACRAAAVHDKIESFPDKYQSTVGERGVKLSGGELQRVSIARAILRRPKIVLLDEATSMVDAETESLIQEGIKRLTAGRTTFIIAHRLSTIQHADLILVIHDGSILERGTHDELIRLDGKYAALWSKQLSKDVMSVGAALDVQREDRSSDDSETE